MISESAVHRKTERSSMQGPISQTVTGRIRRRVAPLLTVTAVAASTVLAGCSSYSNPSYEPSGSSVSCSSLRETVLERIRTGDTSYTINYELQDLTDHCSDDYSFVISYNALWMEAQSGDVQPCNLWVGRPSIEPAALELFRSEGGCTDAPPEPAAPAWPDGGLGWNEAINYMGTTQRVCGPLRSARNTEWGIFVNVGEDYPSPSRFTFVVWGDWWMDPITPSATICATGPISSYEGVVQMELADPGQLEIWS